MPMQVTNLVNAPVPRSAFSNKTLKYRAGRYENRVVNLYVNYFLLTNQPPTRRALSLLQLNNSCQRLEILKQLDTPPNSMPCLVLRCALSRSTFVHFINRTELTGDVTRPVIVMKIFDFQKLGNAFGFTSARYFKRQTRNLNLPENPVGTHLSVREENQRTP